MRRAICLGLGGLALGACSDGSVRFGDYGPERLPIDAQEVATPRLVDDAGAHDVFFRVSTLQPWGAGDLRGLSDLWLLPRDGDGRDVVRRLSVHKSTYVEAVTHSALCAIDLRYAVEATRACGEGRVCLTLAPENAAQHGDDEICRDLEFVRHDGVEVVEDRGDFSLTYPELDVAGAADGSGIAWRHQLASTWSPVAPDGAPPALAGGGAHALPDGKVLVFGDTPDGRFAGGIYDPGAGTWAALPAAGMPEWLGFGVAAWVDDRLLVVTRGQATWLVDGAWETAPTAGLPDFAGDVARGCVRLGVGPTQVLIYGGLVVDGSTTSAGAVLDRGATTWRPVPAVGMPHVACVDVVRWTGDEFVVVGSDGTHALLPPADAGPWREVALPEALTDGKYLDGDVYRGAYTMIASGKDGERKAYELETPVGEWQAVDRERYAAGVGLVGTRVEVHFGGRSMGDGAIRNDGRVPFPPGKGPYGRDAAVYVPNADFLQPRVEPLVAYVPRVGVLVWGGCTAGAADSCSTPAADGAFLRTDLGP